jgi:hypothetical protein
VLQNGMKRTTEIKHVSIPFTTTIQMAAGWIKMCLPFV